MTCFETGWAVLLNIGLWKDWSAILTPVIAVAGVIYAARQIFVAKREARRSTAYSIYNDYLKMCMDHPTFAKGLFHDKDDYDRYKWFVSRMLFSFEQIIEVCNSKDDNSWVKTIENQLKRHKFHLEKSGTVKRKEWGEGLIKAINKAMVDER